MITKKFFVKLSSEQTGEIYNTSKQIDFNNLNCYFENKELTRTIFISFRGPLHLYKNIYNGNTNIEKAKEDRKNQNYI